MKSKTKVVFNKTFSFESEFHISKEHTLKSVDNQKKAS